MTTNNNPRHVLETIASVAARRGAVTPSDVRATESLVAQLNADSDAVTEWAATYGIDANAVAATANVTPNASVRIQVETMGRAYMAATIYVLIVARRGYNRGELFELAASIAVGRFPSYGVANNRAAAIDEPDIRLANGIGVSVKRADVGATFKSVDMADMLMVGFGNVPFFYLLNNEDWKRFEDKFTSIDKSRGTRRSPKSKRAAAEMVVWLECLTA